MTVMTVINGSDIGGNVIITYLQNVLNAKACMCVRACVCVVKKHICMHMRAYACVRMRAYACVRMRG